MNARAGACDKVVASSRPIVYAGNAIIRIAPEASPCAGLFSFHAKTFAADALRRSRASEGHGMPAPFIRTLIEIVDSAIDYARRSKNYERADYWGHVRNQLADMYADTGVGRA